MKTKLVWVGAYPAHYMSEFHKRLEVEFDGLHFIYKHKSQRGIEFSHEHINLPKRSTVLSLEYEYLNIWRKLNFLDPQSILIAGNYPRLNLVAALWAHQKKRSLYYLSDSNVLDLKNIKRSFINKIILRILFSWVTKFLVIGKRNQDFYIDICGLSSMANRNHHFPLPHLSYVFENVQPKNSSEYFSFLVLGRLVEQKSVDHAIRAFSKLEKKDQLISKLIIAGDGPLKPTLENLVKLLGIMDRVVFLGSIPSDKTPEIYGNVDAVIVPSSQEPWGLVVNEALSSARPVITSYQVGSCIDLVQDGVTGFVLESNSPESIKNAMKHCLDHRDEIKKIGLAGRNMIRDRGWHIDQSIESIRKLLK
jgi:glycosyltransferase involved in cell wall biosynthesis